MKTLTLTLILLCLTTMAFAGDFDYGQDAYTQYQYDVSAQRSAQDYQVQTTQGSIYGSGASTYRAPAVTTMFSYDDWND